MAENSLQNQISQTRFISLEQQKLPRNLSGELGKWLFYVAAEIKNFEIIEQKDLIEGVMIYLEIEKNGAGFSETDFSALENKIVEVVKKQIIPKKLFHPKVIWKSAANPHFRAKVFDDLIKKEVVFEAGEGQVAFGEPLISLMSYFDNRLRKIALSLPNASEFQYPTLIPTGVLEKCGYFSSFPQFVLFVTRLHNDIEVYDAFLTEYESNQKITKDFLKHCQSHEYCLPPTMCYHTYHQHFGKNLKQDKVVTSRGKSFRYESKYYSGLERLWDFTIREIVFLGKRDFVIECRQQFMRKAFELMDELNLGGFCEVANDPFFITAGTIGKDFSQRIMELKYELRLNVEEDKTIAVGSFNYHDDFFGRGFQIFQAADQPAASGCVGFGLERLVYAFLCQHGIEPSKWSPAVQKQLKYTDAVRIND